MRYFSGVGEPLRAWCPCVDASPPLGPFASNYRRLPAAAQNRYCPAELVAELARLSKRAPHGSRSAPNVSAVLTAALEAVLDQQAEADLGDNPAAELAAIHRRIAKVEKRLRW